MSELQKQLTEIATELDVPGVAAGILHNGEEEFAFHGVTNVDNPLPVDETTIFQYGSTHKTFTATAIMRLVEQGKVDLDATVRTYIPELKTKDASVAERITVLQLLNHTAGWTGDASEDCGDGDDAREIFVERLADFDQVTPLGATVSYNNAALNVAGRVIEKVTGKVYEEAMTELIHKPLGLESTFFFPNDVMARRFVVGHSLSECDGTIKVARPWGLARAGAPAGGFGVSANAGDQIKWARFHLGDGTSPDGTRLLSKETLDLMKQQTVAMPGSAIGDAVGISWLLRDVGGMREVGHGGTTIGQYSQFRMFPEANFALISMTNCGPNGSQLNRRLAEWALEACLGITVAEAEPIALGDEALAAYVGSYETVAAFADVSAKDGGLVVNVRIKPEMLERLRKEGEEVPEQPPIPLGLLPGDGDRYVVSGGPAKGMKGYFMRDETGAVTGVHFGGRLAVRTRVPAEVSS
jgi:CubicO group peptidase (beta-lactamase class C family)